MFYIILMAVMVAADQAEKYLISHTMELYETIPVVGDLFRITYIHNTGAAFGMMAGMRWILCALPIVVAAVMIAIIFRYRGRTGRTALVALSMIAAGGIGNVIDRMRLGYVVDMFDLKNFAVFNVADIFVCVGCGLLALYMILSDRRGEKRGR